MKTTMGTTRPGLAARASLVAAMLLWALACAGPAQAAYPTRPITMIIPFAVGGPTDLLGRVVASEMGEILGQQIVVENKPGAGGVIATSTLARANPDGYTLLFHEIAATFAIQPLLNKSLPYDVEKDFTPIGLAARGPIFLLVNSELDIKDAKGLLDLARKRPGEISFASAGGIGQLPTHIGPELLRVQQQVDIRHIPYKGTGPALVDVAGGRVSFIMTTGTGSAQGFLDTGKLRAVAVTGQERSPALPDVPTFAEQGVPIQELNDGTAWGLVGPRGIPPEIVKVLDAALQKTLAQPAVKKNFATLDIRPSPSSAQDLQALMDKERATWKPLIQKMDIAID